MLTKSEKGQSYSRTRSAIGGVPTAPIRQVAPVITGTAKVGSALTTTGGTWTGKGVPVLYCQWLKNGVNIPGAWPEKTYVPVFGDIGAVITVRVTGENWKGKVLSAVSAATVAVVE